MERTLIKDPDWTIVEGELCRVTEFVPFAKVENGDVISIPKTPYASVHLECAKIPENAVGYISHKEDFGHLWFVFRERGVAPDEEVLITWTKKPLRGIYKLLSAFMPRLWVAICKKGAFDLVVDQERRGEPKFLADMPIALWQPKVWGYD